VFISYSSQDAVVASTVVESLEKTKEAREKYEEALKYAPNWRQLKEVRDAAERQKI
jgi:hypothetical protein